MNKFLSRIGVVIGILILGNLVRPASAKEPAEKKFPPDKLVEDFRLVRKALEEMHSGIYRYTSKADMDRAFDDAEKSLGQPMDVYGFYRVVAPVVATVKCGHTGIQLPRSLAHGPLLPLSVRLIDRK